MTTVRVYPPRNPGTKHLGSACASGVPLLDRTVTVGSEGDESYKSFMYTSKQNQPTNDEKKRKLQLSTSSDDDGDVADVVEPSTEFVPFLVVEPANKNESIGHSIFAVQKYATVAIGTIKSAKKLRSGSLLLEVRSRAQYDLAMKLTKWVDVDVKVSEHRGLNTCRGIIRCRDLRDCSDEDILEALQSQKVTAVRHIMTKKDGKTIPTNTFILTFRLPSPPAHITAAYLRIPVERFIPNPLRCYNCQRYGHGKVACNRPMACARCGQEGHVDADCVAPEHCCNCKGSHVAYSKECPEWQRQRDITRLKFEKNISFVEAKQLYETASTKQTQKTFAAAVRSTQSASTQTDYTWPLTSDKPVMLASKSVTTSTTTTGCQTPIIPASTTSPCTPSTSTPVPATDPPVPSTSSSSTAGSKPQPSTSKTTAPAKQQNKQQSSNKPFISRPSKGSDDPIKQYNKFGPLNDMEVDPGPSK